MYSNMSFVNKDSFTTSFPIWMPFICSSYLIAVASISCTMLNKRGESGCLCLVPDIKGNTYSFCPLSMMLAVGHHTTYLLHYYQSCNISKWASWNQQYLFFHLFFPQCPERVADRYSKYLLRNERKNACVCDKILLGSKPKTLRKWKKTFCPSHLGRI